MRVNGEVLLQQTETTCSGIHPDILKYSKRTAIAPIVAKSFLDNHPVSCWLVFPGCDFEVMLKDDVAVAFRRENVMAICAEFVAQHEAHVLFCFSEWPAYGQEDFNAQLLDNMMIALRGVTGKGNIVADSRHFVAVMAKAIEKLEALGMYAIEVDFVKEDEASEVISRINDIKLDIFRQLMSKDLRK